MVYKTESKMQMGFRTYCPVCGNVMSNTPLMGRRVDKRSKLTCPYCGKALKRPKKPKMKQVALQEAFMHATESLEKLSKDRVIPTP